MVLGGFVGPLTPAARAESRLDVSAGYGGFHVPGRSLPVQVTVTAERLVKGELVVLGTGSSPRASLPVEVAGGSVKRFTLIVPGGVTSSSGSIDVELRVGGRALGRGKAEVKDADDTELVGLGPQLVEDSLPGPAPLTVDAGVARFAALDAGLLAQAPTSLEPLSAVGLGSGELTALAPGVRAGLLRWVGSGGHLLLDKAPGTAIDGLPAEWQPGPAGRVAAGVGEVRLTGDAMSAGRWAGLIEPSSVGRDAGPNGFFSPESVADSLARDAGLRLPGLPWLLGFLGLYIAVVGPVTGFVLRWRRRPDLAWVVVPGLAVIFTVLAYGAGNQLRPGAGLAHGTVLETGASGPVATSWVALTRRNAGTAKVALPSGWAIKGSVSNNGNGFGPATPLLTVGDSGGPEAQLPLASGEFGVFKAQGPVTVNGRLEVTASSSTDSRAEGTIRNGLPFALDEVIVLVDGRRARVGRLAPGEQKQWSAAGAKNFDPSGSDAWMSEMGFRSDGLVNFALWQSAQDDLGQDGDPTGTALAVGWTRDWKPEFSVDGQSRTAPGRTAVVGRAPVTAGGRITDMTVAADVVRGPSLNPFHGKFIGNNTGEASVVKLTLPPGPAGRHLMVRTSLPLSAMAVWRNGAWHHLDGAVIRANDLNAMLRFKRNFAVNGRGIAIDVAPPGAVTTTTAPFAPGQVPPTTFPMPVPPKMTLEAPAMAVPAPDGLVGGANATVDIPLPDGIGADGVVFLRLVADASMGIGGDAVLSLVEVGK